MNVYRLGITSVLAVALHATPAIANSGESDWRKIEEVYTRTERLGVDVTYDLGKPDEAEKFDSLAAYHRDQIALDRAAIEDIRKRRGEDVRDIVASIQKDFGEKPPAGLEKAPPLGDMVAQAERNTRVMPERFSKAIEWNVTRIERRLGMSGNMTEQAVVKYVQDTTATIERLKLIAGDHPKVAELEKAAREQLEQYTEQVKRAIADRRMPENAPKFAGPGEIPALIDASKAYLAQSAKWKNWQVLHVRVTGEWFVAETNLLEQPIRYALPIAVVATNDELKSRGVARIFYIYTLTEIGPSVERKPPFTGFLTKMSADNPSDMLLEHAR